MSMRRALVVEDQADDVASIKRFLRDLGVDQWDVIESAALAEQRLGDGSNYDLHVFDLCLPDANKLELLERLDRMGFTAWRRSIVVTGQVDADDQHAAIGAFGVPVLDKSNLSGTLEAWAKSIVGDRGSLWMTRMVAGLGAALWGNQGCGFVWATDAEPKQLQGLTSGNLLVQIGLGTTLAILPNVTFKTVDQTREAWQRQLPGSSEVRSLMVTDLHFDVDLHHLCQEILIAFRRSDFTGGIWPVAQAARSA